MHVQINLHNVSCRESDNEYDKVSHRVAKCSHCHGIDRQSDSKQKFNELSSMSFAVSGKLKISDFFLRSLKKHFFINNV